MPIQLVGTDLDGTFLREDGTPHPDVLRELDLTLQAGIQVCFVTGRPARWIKPVADLAGHRGMAVGSNGAALIDLHDERIVEVDVIPVDAAAEAVHRLRKLDADTGFAFDRSRAGDALGEADYAPGFVREHKYNSPWDVDGISVVDDVIEHLAPGHLVKLLARPSASMHAQGADYWLDAAREVLAGIVEVTHSTKGDIFLEMSADGVTKASGLKKIADSLGISASSVMAVGDMPNDLPMLMWVGTSFAVANAHPTVLRAVHEHVAANDDGGVAEVLRAARQSHS